MLDSEDDGLFNCLNSIEFFLLVLSFVVYSTCAYIICETPLLHVNFMRLYKCFYIEYLVFTVTRIIKLIATLTRVTGLCDDVPCAAAHFYKKMEDSTLLYSIDAAIETCLLSIFST